MAHQDFRPQTRLFLITPLKMPDKFAAQLEGVLKAGDIASVLIWGEKDEGADYLARAKELVPLIQTANAAALLRGSPQNVGRAGADGFHADTNIDDLKLAIGDEAKFIVGAGNLIERHDAMEAGEAGVDYVLFGDPRKNLPLDFVAERTTWWQSLFQPPCVALSSSLDDVEALADAGADFVALGEALWQCNDPEKSVADLSAMLDARPRSE